MSVRGNDLSTADTSVSDKGSRLITMRGTNGNRRRPSFDQEKKASLYCYLSHIQYVKWDSNPPENHRLERDSFSNEIFYPGNIDGVILPG